MTGEKTTEMKLPRSEDDVGKTLQVVLPVNFLNI